MSDEQHSKNPGQDSDFGAIQISSDPPPRSGPTEESKRAAAAAAKQTARSPKTNRSGANRFWLALALLPLPLLLLLYFAGIRYLLPLYIQGELAGKLARELGRPITIGQAHLSPFTFALHLGKINLGPATAQPDESDLARIAALDAWLRPAGLLRGQIVLDNVRIDRLRANVLRRQDGSFNVLPSSSSLFNGLDMLPDWLHVHGLRLHRSTIHFLDQPSDKRHLVEHIEFVLPADTQGAEPSLSASVNSSPLQIIGGQEGGKEARFMLKLDEIEPQQYLGLFPSLAEKVHLSAGRADALVEIILQDKTQPGYGPTISGEMTFTNLLAQSADAEEQPEQAFRLAAPKAQLVVRANPLKNIYTIAELHVEEPQLELPKSQQNLLHGEQLAAKAAGLLNYGPLGLAVEKLSLSKGQVRSGATAWQDINLKLTDFQNAKLNDLREEKKTSAALSLTAVSSKQTTLSFQGSLAPQGNLFGSLSLKNAAAADLLQPYLGHRLRLNTGRADIAGELLLAAGTSGSLAKTSLTLRDFRLQQDATELLSAKLLQATDCALERGSGMVCGKTVLEEADFAATDIFLSGSGLNGFACADLELKKSAAKLRLGGIMLPLSDLHLRLHSLPGQLDLQAAIGRWGSLEISGQAEKGNKGLHLNGIIKLRNAGAALLRPYLAASQERISFLRGGADISGALRLHEGRLNLSNGTVALRNFVLQRKGAVLLSGKSMHGNDCALDRAARSLRCTSISLAAADFADADYFLRPADRLHLAADKVEITNSVAQLRLVGAAPLALSKMNLNLSGLHGKEPGTISLTAAANKSGKVAIKGTASATRSGLSVSGNLTLDNLPAQLLHSSVFQDKTIRFSKGRLDISGAGSLQQTADGAALSLSDSTVQLHDFSLERGKATLLAGKVLTGAQCSLDRRLSCASISMDAADFPDADFFLRPADRLHLAADKVDIKNSAAKLRLAGAAPLALAKMNLNLSGLRDKEPARIMLDAAADGSGKFEIKGTASAADAGLRVSGSLSLRNMSASLLNPFLAQGRAMRCSKGRLDISGTGSLQPTADGAALRFSDSTVQLHDFTVQGNGAALFSGKSMTGDNCSLNQHLSCGKLALSQADFAAQAVGFFFQPQGTLGFACNALEISNSAALLPIGAGANQPKLPLAELQLRLNQKQANNLHVEAVAGSQGRLQAEGTLRNGSGTVSLTGSDVDIRLFNKAVVGLFRKNRALALQEGRLNFKGQFSMPENRFNGQFSIDDLAAGNEQGDSLRWQKAAASKAVVTLSPFTADVDQLSFHEPAARLASEDSSLPRAFFALFQALPQVSVQQCSISKGSFNNIKDIQAAVTPLRAGTTADFSLSGMMHGSPFSLSGKAGKDKTEIEQLSADKLPLTAVAEKIAAQFQLTGGAISRTVTSKNDQLDFTDFKPQSESKYALILALLTDENGAFFMPLQSLPLTASEETVSATAAGKFEQLYRECLAEPWALLDKLIPDISKAQKIDFKPGDKSLDLLNSLKAVRSLFSVRPHVGWAVQGCYAAEADAKTLLAQVRHSQEQEVAEENLRRQKEMERLLAKETARQENLNKKGLPIVKDLLPEIKTRPELQPLPVPQAQAELPEQALPDLAADRAAAVREQLVSKLGLPADHLHIYESGDCGAQAELIPVPIW